jgi:hypothetical protein
MDTRRNGYASILASILFAGLASCSEQSDQPATAASAGGSCKAPGTSAAIERALCSGSPSELQDALFSESSKPFEAAHQELLIILRRIWDADASYGKELPWQALKSARNRAVIAEQLAQGIRNREIEGSLESLQQFAVEFVHGAKTDTEQLDGLRLLGLTDAQSQIPMLRSIAQSAEGQAIRREYAIEALGRICAPEAEAALREIARTIPAGGSDERRLAAALSARESLARSWCRQPESLPAQPSEAPR